MCNRVHEEGKEPIPESGIGWKIFRKHNSVCKGMYGAYYFNKNTDGFFRWKSDSYFNQKYEQYRVEFGFCFFKTREEARKALHLLKNTYVKQYDDCVVRKIKYKKGLASFNSTELDGIRRRFCLAKQFKIVENSMKEKEFYKYIDLYGQLKEETEKLLNCSELKQQGMYKGTVEAINNINKTLKSIKKIEKRNEIS